MPRQPLFLGWPEGPSLARLEAGWSALPPTFWLHWEGQSGGPQTCCPPPTDSAMPGGVCPSVTGWSSSQSKHLGVLQASCSSSLPLHVHTSAHPRTLLHTLAHSRTHLHTIPLPIQARTLPLLLSVSCISLGPGPFTSFPPTLSAPKSVKGPEEPRSCSLLFHSGCFQKDEENMSVNLMFLGCLIKRDKIAEELRAGLAGVGSHALLPPLRLPAELCQLLLPTPPLGSRWPWRPSLPRPLHLLARTSGGCGRTGPSQARGSQGVKGCPEEVPGQGLLRHIPCACAMRSACSLPVPAALPCKP
ncbi:uncharacterized protein LOC119467620 [Cebus imitator]|uniref:uncharacterized protein LOC119467620 n=1 Tax=Cebus imitator TaxID=2715852 RepID=UPI001896BC97|nr:uncharacterized protein LOC119467620 [Cebus imitator]